MTDLFVLLVSSTIKATAILVIAVLLARLMRHRSAASRHLIWSAGLASTVAVFLLASVAPAWRVIPLPSPSIAMDAASAPTALSLPVQRAAIPSSVSEASPGVVPVPAPGMPTRPSHPTDWPARILLIWGIGAVALLVRDIAGRITLYRLSRAALVDAESAALTQQLGRAMGINRRVRVSRSDDVELPMTWGILHPRILLPGDVPDWSPACRRHVLQHELAHISRRDAATQLVAQAATVLFWFHPLLWLAAARMRTERERACDDQVLACGAVASDYATDLLTFVTHHGFATPQGFALGFAERSKFEQRLRALLDPSIPRGVLSPSRVALVLGFSALLVVPLAALQRAMAPPPQRTLVQADAVVIQAPPVYARARVIPVTSRTIAESNQPVADGADTLDAFAGCAMRITSQHSDGTMDGDGQSRWTATGENPGCRYSLASAGTIVLNGDATAIERISADGYLDVSTNIHGDLTRLVARASATGGIGYEWSHNGTPVDFAAGGETWLKRFLLCVDRTTAFAIDRRFPQLLAAGGPGNVLAEVERMHSDHAMTMYLLRVTRSAALDAIALEHVAHLVSAMSAQHMAGDVIIAVAARQHLTDDAREAFARLADDIRESSQRTRALAALSRAR